MTRAIAPWLLRAGAVLAAAAFFLPHADVAGRSFSPLAALRTLSRTMSPFDLAAHAAWFLAPVAAGLEILLGSLFARRVGPIHRGGVIVITLAAAFGLATQGSILLTSLELNPGVPMPPYALCLALFILPLVAAVVLVGRMLGEAAPGATAAAARLSLGVFLALNGLYLLTYWWSVFAAWIGNAGSADSLAGAWAGPAAGLLIVLGEALGPAWRASIDRPPDAG